MKSIYRADEEGPIGERVLREFGETVPDWSKYTLLDVHRAYNALISWRKKQRTRKKGGEVEWNQNGEKIRTIQGVLAGKWAERGKPALMSKIAEMEANCADLERINNYDDLFLAELRSAYQRIKGETE